MKNLFVFAIDSTIDLITNSSSELFVFTGNTKKKVQRLVAKTYPEYLSEYDEIVGIEDLSDHDLETYVSSEYRYDNYGHHWGPKPEPKLIPGFTFEETYYKEEGSWGTHYYPHRITAETRQKIIDAIDPKRKLFFMFSLDENPDWDKQEDLMGIGTRYHLG